MEKTHKESPLILVFLSLLLVVSLVFLASYRADSQAQQVQYTKMTPSQAIQVADIRIQSLTQEIAYTRGLKDAWSRGKDSVEVPSFWLR